MLKIARFNPKRGNYGKRRDCKDIKYILVSAINNPDELLLAHHYGEMHTREVTKFCPNWYVDRCGYKIYCAKEYYVPHAFDEKFLDKSNPKAAHYYGQVKNANCIWIVVDNIRSPFPLVNMAEKHLTETVRFLCKKYGIPKQRVVRPFDVNGSMADDYFVQDEVAWKLLKMNLDLPRVYVCNRKGIPGRTKPSMTDWQSCGTLDYHERIAIKRIIYREGHYFGISSKYNVYIDMKFLKTEYYNLIKQVNKNPDMELSRKNVTILRNNRRFLFPKPNYKRIENENQTPEKFKEEYQVRVKAYAHKRYHEVTKVRNAELKRLRELEKSRSEKQA